MMWRGRRPVDVVCMDKESALAVPPDVVAVWAALPFRDDVFSLVIFDPPHTCRGETSIMSLQGSTAKSSISWFGALPARWRETAHLFLAAQNEFRRVARRMIFKWNDTRYNLHRVLSCFYLWRVVRKTMVKSTKKRGKSDTWWVVLKAKK